MKTLSRWLKFINEAKGMPEEIRERAWTISRALMKFDGKILGPDGIQRERQAIEKARKAYDEISVLDLSFGHLSAKELAEISWEPFAEAGWTAFVKGMEQLEQGIKAVDRFAKTAKWLVPILTDRK